MNDAQYRLNYETVVALMKQQIELQEQLLITLKSHHADARKAWNID